MNTALAHVYMFVLYTYIAIQSCVCMFTSYVCIYVAAVCCRYPPPMTEGKAWQSPQRKERKLN